MMESIVGFFFVGVDLRQFFQMEIDQSDETFPRKLSAE